MSSPPPFCSHTIKIISYFSFPLGFFLSLQITLMIIYVENDIVNCRVQQHYVNL